MKPDNKIEKTWKYYLGIGLFIYSFIPYIIAAILPLMGISIGKLLSLITILIVSAEVAFFISIVLLGKAMIQKTKNFFYKLFIRKKPMVPVQVTVISKIRHRIGIILFILSAIPYPLSEVAMFFGYPHSGEHTSFLLMLLAGDAVFIAAFFVLGAEFFEKVKNLFRREAIY